MNGFDNNNIDYETNQSNQKKKPKKRFHIFATIILAAIITILYISNLMYVNKLLDHVHKLNREYDKVLNKNELIKQEIIRLESPDRIIPYAEKNLNMVISANAPKKID